jgi:hypothetical protein
MSVSGLAKVVALSDNEIVKKFTGVRCRLERSGGLHSATSVEGRFRPIAAFHRYFPMLRCGPSKPPFAQGAAF